MRAVLAGDLGISQLAQEVARAVEVGHLQIGRADAVRTVGGRAGTARQPVPVGELRGTLVSAGFSVFAPVFSKTTGLTRQFADLACR